MKPAVCIATVGGQPQLITYYLDGLIEKRERIEKLILLRLSPRNARLQQAHSRLMVELRSGRYPGLNAEWFTLAVNGFPLEDIRSTAEADAASSAIHQLIHGLKLEGNRLHVGVTGGRRMLGMVTMSTAMLNFDRNDRLWHMHTPDEFRKEARGGNIMHIPDGIDFKLIEVPILPLGHYFAQLHGFGGVTQQRFVLNQQEKERAQRVVDQLTRRQKEVLALLARGQSPTEAAKTLKVTVATINTHKTVIFACCRNEWGFPTDERLTYYFLQKKFEMHFRDDQSFS
ncbi:MAG: CRISPR-associated ring nuclease [Ardenticatenaceae bacterium]|nr:CRISPR-associated ring nuclease [Ardenticatenaceae bacterium]